jgi:LCP family protein required for cell wall assembly
MAPPTEPDYTLYRTRPKLPFRRERDPLQAPQRPEREPEWQPGRRRRITPGRILKWLVVVLVAWIVVSGALFLVSAQIEQGKVPDDADDLLGGGGVALVEPTNVLVLGSDLRSEDTAEPGASTSGASRADSIMLLRVGGGVNRRLSIARDTRVDIPGRGRDRINAAFAYGGPALAIATVEGYTGIDINHLILVSFDEFPDLVDAMGGIVYTGGCVVSRVNGGYANGGVTVRIRAGEPTHLNGDQALALARTRKNDCRRREDDLSRARRQQRIISAMKSRVLSPAGFARLPWISWQAPRTFRTDMSGPTLAGVFASMAVGGSPRTRVLGTTSGEVPDAVREREVARFLGRR